jgi:hypothetical protein
MAKPVLDLNYRQWVHRSGGLTAIGTWVRQPGQLRWRPCMAIIRTDDEGDTEHERVRPCIVNLDNAWIWSEEHGDAEGAADILAAFCLVLRMSTDDLPKLFDLIRSRLQDLVEMPPRPVALLQREAANV